MTNGPPSAAASSSKNPANSSGASRPTPQRPPDPRFTIPNVEQFQQWTPQYAGYYASPPTPQLNGFAGPGMTSSMSHYPEAIANPYLAANATQSQYYRNTTPSLNASLSAVSENLAMELQEPQARPSTPPCPQPETYKHWDEIIKRFLAGAKLLQTLKGFENDMLLLNSEWEQKVIPEALKEMVTSLQTILDRIAGKSKKDEDEMDISSDVEITAMNNKPDEESALDKRKLEYVSLASGVTLRPHSSINKSISQFLAQTRARNDASNRSEFLYTLAEKKRKLQQDGKNPEEVEISSCARVDAKPIDRDSQMKYDIAKNGEGPLRKAVKPDSRTTQDKKRKFVAFDDSQANSNKSKRIPKRKERETDREPILPDESTQDIDEVFEAQATAEDYPVLDERLKNLEEHLALRYVPSIPRTLFSRLKYLEEHVIKLEKEYPPWAALHFNQPNRGWPAPPRATPIIVPPHLRSSTTTSTTQPNIASPYPTNTNSGTSTLPTSSQATSSAPAGLPIKSRKANSSLHKAVMDRLEVQRAMNEMKGSNS